MSHTTTALQTRRRVLIVGTVTAITLLSGCSGEMDTGYGNKTDDQEHDQPNESERTPKMTIADTTFEVISTENGTGEENVVIDTNGKTVHIEGTITGQNGCYTADLSSVITEGEDLRVQIESYENSDEDELCTEALIGIEYRTKVILSAVPTTVTVEHNGQTVGSD